MDEFDEILGRIMFTMTLDECNTSPILDTESSKIPFRYLSLPYYPGEKIEFFAIEDLCLQKIYQWGGQIRTKANIHYFDYVRDISELPDMLHYFDFMKDAGDIKDNFFFNTDYSTDDLLIFLTGCFFKL